MDYNVSTGFSIGQAISPIYNSVNLNHGQAGAVSVDRKPAWAVAAYAQSLLAVPWSLVQQQNAVFQAVYNLAAFVSYAATLNYWQNAVASLSVQIWQSTVNALSPVQVVSYALSPGLTMGNNALHTLGYSCAIALNPSWSVSQALALNVIIKRGVFPLLVDGVPVVIIPGALPNPDWRPNQSTNSVLVPIRSYYPVANSFSMVRLPERTQIECLSLGLSIDTSSWGWSVSAEVDQSAYDLLFPSPGQSVEIEILINGLYLFTAVVNKLPRKRSFGKNSFSLAASSRAVWLTEPFAAVSQRLNTSAITAQQLAAEALLAAPFAGDTGFSLNWGLLDWLVPANAYSHTGSPMQYLSDIVTAVGASIQAHRSDWQLNIASLFPIPSWQWATATPDYIIPVDALQTDLLEWDELPNINGITLSGGAVGGIINVTRRAGTAGDKLLQPITHPLFTDVYATQQRAKAELSKSGRRFKSVITLPVLPETGIIDTNKLIRITEGASSLTWMSRANSVSAKFGEAMQSITLERYESVV